MSGNHSFRMNANGSIGVNLNNLQPASFYKGDTSKPFLRQAGLWIVAKDQDDKYHTATHYQTIPGNYDFWSGPADTLTGETSLDPKWNKTWTVTSEQIKNHQRNFTQSSYDIPAAISDWPAQGSDGFAKYLAPFIDYNKNGKYDPENGDYPDIKGKKSAYCIFNDIQGEHQASKGQELGIEIALMISETSGSKKFLEYYIINRKSNSYPAIYTGFFIDGQCGNRDDNFAGTFENFPHSIFVYNKDNFDENHFKESKPYVIATFLNENLSSSIAFNDGSSKNGYPVENTHFIHYSESKWKDGTDLTFGGDGTLEGNPVQHIYSQSNLGGSNFWTEEQALNTPGGRTIIGFIRNSSFQSGDYLKIDICLDAGVLKKEEDTRAELQRIARANFASFRQSSSVKKNIRKSMLLTYPNPSNGVFKVESNQQIKSIQITDIKGLTIMSQNDINKNEFSCNILETPGIYYIHITTDEGTKTEKLCIRL